MNKNFLPFFILIGLLVLGFHTTYAQAELTLGLGKTYGYNDFSGNIEGTFTLKAEGVDNLSRVVFFIDGQPMAEAKQAPFSYQFKTGNFPPGVHEFTATGYTTDGKELASNAIRKNFFSAEESRGSTVGLILPILGLVVGALVLTALISIRFGSKKLLSLPPGAPRSYPMGGTICPKCGRPFGIHIWGLNVLIGKFDRCPYCGKWSMVTRFSAKDLRQAELAEMEDAQQSGEFTPASDEERLRKELDDSRYQDY